MELARVYCAAVKVMVSLYAPSFAQLGENVTLPLYVTGVTPLAACAPSTYESEKRDPVAHVAPKV